MIADRSSVALLSLAFLVGCSDDPPSASTASSSSSGMVGDACAGVTCAPGAACGGAGQCLCPAGTEGDPAVECYAFAAAEGRVLAMEVNQPEGEDHLAMLDVAQGIGVGGIPPTLPWSFLEPTSGALDLSLLKVALELYRARGLKVLLSIPTVDTVSLLVPEDLRPDLESGAVALDDPIVTDRFKALLDQVLAAAGEELAYLIVGNEVDVYLSGKPDDRRIAYRGFIDAAQAFVAEKRPGLAVGVNITFGGISDPRWSDLTSGLPIATVSYYSKGNDFSGMPAGDIRDDMAAMVAFAGQKPLILKECGYPTGEAAGGSDEGQVAFARRLFRTWDEHRAKVPYLVLSRMFDGARATCENEAKTYGFPGDEAFIQFLCTLGYRTHDDAPKPAWEVLVEVAENRGFSGMP